MMLDWIFTHWLWTEALAAYTNATASAAYSFYGGGLDILWLARLRLIISTAAYLFTLLV